jgi:hypothetical protein
MQGLKHFSPQLFYQTSLDSLVPKDNFYRILLQELDLNYLYASTSKYYGREGQESIDPVVFFKIIHLQNTANHSPKNDLRERTSLFPPKQHFSQQNRGYKLSENPTTKLSKKKPCLKRLKQGRKFLISLKFGSCATVTDVMCSHSFNSLYNWFSI